MLKKKRFSNCDEAFLELKCQQDNLSQATGKNNIIVLMIVFDIIILYDYFNIIIKNNLVLVNYSILL